jgi:hypothetical protein
MTRQQKKMARAIPGGTSVATRDEKGGGADGRLVQGRSA